MSKTQTLPLGGLCLLVNSQEVCVVANGAMRFGCVVPFGTTHFLFKEENPMKRTITSIFAIMLALAMVMSLAACGGSGENSKTSMTKEEMLKIAQPLSNQKLYEELSNNKAKAMSTYQGNTYSIWGIIKEINADSVDLIIGEDTHYAKDEYYIRAFLPNDELIQLNIDNGIQIVGTITDIQEEKQQGKIISSFYISLKDAHFITDEYEIKNANVIETGESTKSNSKYCKVKDDNFNSVKIMTNELTSEQRNNIDDYTVSATGKIATGEWEDNTATVEMNNIKNFEVNKK